MFSKQGYIQNRFLTSGKKAMATVIFDTPELVDKLKSAGISQEQAETVVRVIAEAQDTLATKEYFGL